MYLPYVRPPMTEVQVTPQQLLRLQDGVNAQRSAAMNWMNVVYGRFDRNGAEQPDQQMSDSAQSSPEEPWRCRVYSLLYLL